MSEEIKAGDVVQLKSGGPGMTVEKVVNGEARCFWFANQTNPANPETLVAREFPLVLLRNVSEVKS